MSGPQEITSNSRLTDQFGRAITYLRLSVTDRCDLRCTYCMAENMVFLPKKEVLTLEEMLTVSETFIKRGVKRIRLTGGEPLVRKNIMWFIKAIGTKVKTGELDELTLTTNGTQLPLMADMLYDAGVRRINISLDTLNKKTFNKITRRDQLDQVLKGIEAAQNAGLHVKINTVAMRAINEAEIPDLLRWACSKNLDLTLIETMPLGEIDSAREDIYLPLSKVKADLEKRFSLQPSTHKTGGPARYYTVNNGGTKLGLITPLTNNFCDGCNRMRVTCTGRIYMCLGQDDHVDLRTALRGLNSEDALSECLNKALGNKPRAHDFAMSDGKMIGKVNRHMSQTGG